MAGAERRLAGDEFPMGIHGSGARLHYSRFSGIKVSHTIGPWPNIDGKGGVRRNTARHRAANL